MFTAYEVDYHNRCWSIGKFDDFKKAKNACKKALKKSNHEFSTFISDGKKVVADIR